MSANNGGAAFPVSAGNTVYGGMSLRDYFAAQALPSLISDGKATDAIGKICRERNLDGLATTAKMCYAYADAMLAERSKP